VKTYELNKRLLVALGLSETSAQIVIEHIDELTSEAGKLRTEVICLKQDLKDANMGRCTCSDCGKVVGNAWRDSDGHHCLTCLAKQRDDARENAAMAKALADDAVCPVVSPNTKI
jgi:hypothetical protein